MKCMDEVNELLWQINVDEVRKYYHKTGHKGSKPKADMIEGILDFYSTDGWLKEYFQQLKGFELEYTELLVKQNFHPIQSELNAILSKYNVQKDWMGRIEIDLLFMIHGVVPQIFKEELLKLVPAIEVRFSGYDEKQVLEYAAEIVNEENPMQKFDDFVLFLNQNKVKVTDKKQLITKSNILKFYQNYPHQEIAKNEENSLEDIKNQNDAIIINGIETILLSAKVISISDNYLTLGKNYKEYVRMNSLEKAKFLLNEYLTSKSINELEYVKSGIFDYCNGPLMSPRDYVISFIKKMPISKWVLVSDLSRMIRIKDVYFLRKYIGDVSKKDEYSNWFYSCGFDEFEREVIDIILFGYLAPLGIIDITVDWAYTEDYNERFYFYASELRLTHFGALVLDLIQEEIKEENENTSLKVTEDFHIIVSQSSKRMEYELYFDRFLTGIKDKNQTIYEIDFVGLAKANDLGIKAEEILNYLISNTDSLPKNVLVQFGEWIQYAGKVKITTKTVLEAPSEVMERLLHDKKMNEYVDNSKYKNIMIKDKKAKEVKKIVEKHQFFCDID